jgi:hypothetical protein
LKRSFVAFVVAPPVGLVAGFLAAAFPVASLGTLVPLALVTAYPVAVVFGSALLWFAHRRGRPPLLAVMAVAVAIAALAWCFAVWVPATPGSFMASLDALAFSVAAAAVGLAVFWFLAFPRRAA